MKIPHSLRIIIFFLRLALGLSFLYLGASVLYDASLARTLGTRSLTSLYGWLGTGSTLSGQPLMTAFAWAFLIIGICLILGLLMRFAAIVGIALTLVGYWPALVAPGMWGSQFVNDEVLIILSLLILIFSNAGAYIGIDKFLHIHLFGKHKD